MFSIFTAVVISVAIATSYVFVIFWGQNIKQDRNDPQVIRGRIFRVTTLCVVLTATLPILIHYFLNPYPTLLKSYQQLKIFQLPNAKDLQSVLLICILYTGPIWNYFHSINYDLAEWVQECKEELTLIQGIRDLVFAPISEEVVYRSLVLLVYQPLLQSGDLSTKSFITYTPLLFGIAHLNHGYVLYKVKKIDLAMVLFNGVVQFTYTSIFGMLANYLLLRNDSIYGSILVHSMCNLMSFPELVPEMSELIYYPLLIAGPIAFFYYL